MKFVNWMDQQPKWLKALFCIPVISIIWCVYRIIKSVNLKDWLSVILASLLIFVGIIWLWLFDLLFILFKNKILWFER